MHRFVDEGCLNGSVISASNDSRFVACGSDSGILNLYQREDIMKMAAPKPVKTMQNLGISELSVNDQTCQDNAEFR